MAACITIKIDPVYPNRKFNSPAKKYTNMIIGFRAINEAIDADKEFDKILVQKGLKGELFNQLRARLQDFNIPYQLVPLEKIEQLSRGNHQGVIGFTSPIAFQPLEEIIQMTFESGETPKLIYLDGITDVRNFGAICRSAECNGFHAVVIQEKGAAQVNEDAVKTSAGALFHIPLCRVPNAARAIEIFQNAGIAMVGCTEKTEVFIEAVNMSGPTCIIMGSEDTGISNDFIRKADSFGKIHMEGKTSALNVSVAAGIIMYELNRQRRIS